MAIHLEPLSLKYLSPYMELVNDKIVHETTDPNGAFREYSKEELTLWLEGLSGKSDRRDFAILDSDSSSFIGEVVINEIRQSVANIRIAILPRYFDKGYGTQAIQQAAEYASKTLGLEKLELWVFNINPRGIRAYEKCGFKEVNREVVDNNLIEVKMELSFI